MHPYLNLGLTKELKVAIEYKNLKQFFNRPDVALGSCLDHAYTL